MVTFWHQTAILWRELQFFVAAHAGVASLIALAVVMTMPPSLPAPLCKLPALEWAWEWAHDALKTFANMRAPKPPEETKQ